MAKNRKADGGYALGGTYEMTDAQIKRASKSWLRIKNSLINLRNEKKVVIEKVPSSKRRL
jgi:hypothetical protein